MRLSLSPDRLASGPSPEIRLASERGDRAIEMKTEKEGEKASNAYEYSKVFIFLRMSV